MTSEAKDRTAPGEKLIVKAKASRCDLGVAPKRYYLISYSVHFRWRSSSPSTTLHYPSKVRKQSDQARHP